MVKIGSFSDMNPSLYAENWLIVRKPDEVPAFVKLNLLRASESLRERRFYEA